MLTQSCCSNAHALVRLVGLYFRVLNQKNQIIPALLAQCDLFVQGMLCGMQTAAGKPDQESMPEQVSGTTPPLPCWVICM